MKFLPLTQAYNVLGAFRADVTNVSNVISGVPPEKESDMCIPMIRLPIHVGFIRLESQN